MFVKIPNQVKKMEVPGTELSQNRSNMWFFWVGACKGVRAGRWQPGADTAQT